MPKRKAVVNMTSPCIARINRVLKMTKSQNARVLGFRFKDFRFKGFRFQVLEDCLLKTADYKINKS